MSPLLSGLDYAPTVLDLYDLVYARVAVDPVFASRIPPRDAAELTFFRKYSHETHDTWVLHEKTSGLTACWRATVNDGSEEWRLRYEKCVEIAATDDPHLAFLRALDQEQRLSARGGWYGTEDAKYEMLTASVKKPSDEV
jgi:hypothetical protein